MLPVYPVVMRERFDSERARGIHILNTYSISTYSPNILYIPNTGWWFGTCFICPYIWNSNPNWRTHIFQRGRAQPPTSNKYSQHPGRLELRSRSFPTPTIAGCLLARLYDLSPNEARRESLAILSGLVVGFKNGCFCGIFHDQISRQNSMNMYIYIYMYIYEYVYIYIKIDV